MDNKNGRGKEYTDLDFGSSFFRAKHFFFHHLLIYFHVKHPISALHKNHASFEALKLEFWFSVGKDKIHVGCC